MPIDQLEALSPEQLRRLGELDDFADELRGDVKEVGDSIYDGLAGYLKVWPFAAVGLGVGVGIGLVAGFILGRRVGAAD